MSAKTTLLSTTPTALCLAAAVVATCLPCAATAQPTCTECPLNAISFKASHNTYQRDEPNDRQIAEYNCWGVEFDINWDGSDEGRLSSDIWVWHDCYAWWDTGIKTLRTHLSETLQAPWIRERVTFIELEVKNNSDCTDFGTWPFEDGVSLIRDRVALALGDVGMSLANIYTPTDFVNTDGEHWPSWQELVRRQKYLIIILETGCGKPPGPGSRRGTSAWAPAGPGGTSSAPRWRCACSAGLRSTSTRGAWT